MFISHIVYKSDNVHKSISLRSQGNLKQTDHCYYLWNRDTRYIRKIITGTIL